MTWVTILACTILSEILPLRGVPPVALYSYMAAKGVLFVIFGFITPLAFWRYTLLGTSIVLATSVTTIVEMIQSLIEGHRSSCLELLIKAMCILVGFILGLHIRFDRSIMLGPIRLKFLDKHLPILR